MVVCAQSDCTAIVYTGCEYTSEEEHVLHITTLLLVATYIQKCTFCKDNVTLLLLHVLYIIYTM